MKEANLDHFSIENFGPIKKAEVSFGDLTVLIGPQATGKSIFLQMYKWKYDNQLILNSKKTLGWVWPNSVVDMLKQYMGRSAVDLLQENSKMDGKPLELIQSDGKSYSGIFQNVNYIPANRNLFFNKNWLIDPYNGYSSEISYTFSHIGKYLDLFLETIFDDAGQLKKSNKSNKFWYENPIYYGNQPSVFVKNQRKNLAIKIKGKMVVFSDWSNGQKLYLPIAIVIELLMNEVFEIFRPDKKIVIIEEPELGLHPKAIQSFLLQVFRLMQKGFRVVLSTHSELILETMWVLNQISENGQDFRVLHHLFQTNAQPDFNFLYDALSDKSFKTYFFHQESESEGTVVKDISTLDLFSSDASTADWGGFMNFKDRANEVVARVSQ